MKRAAIMLGVLGVMLVGSGWIDYGDKVEKTEPVFGKEFDGFSLKLSTARIEFEQDEAEQVLIEIRNTNERTSLVGTPVAEGRAYALFLVVADKNGTTLFSRNLLETQRITSVEKGQIAPRADSQLAAVAFNDLEVAKVDEYLHGVPSFTPDTRFVRTADLVPQIYTLKAILLSHLPEQRPDFVVASDLSRILLKPKSAQRMSADEKAQKMDKWLKKMSEGAYGGIGVSSQLAALGDLAVDPLIEMAEKTGEGAVGESRVWAIVTLCSTHSKKAEDYILRRMFDPVSFGDLAFLVWHSQGFHSERITKALLNFCEDAANGKPMPWEKTRGPETRYHAKGSLEFAFKHLIAINRSCTDATARGVIAMGDPKVASFGLMAWKPSSPEAALDILSPMFGRRVHGNLKKAVLNLLSQSCGKTGFPKYDRLGDVNGQWIEAAFWLKRQGRLADADLVTGLRYLVFDVRKEAEDTQRELIRSLHQAVGTTFPVTAASPVLPDDWVKTWRWALQTSDLNNEQAVQYICGMMKTRDPIPDVVRVGMLLELKRLIGDRFPLKRTSGVELDEDWPTCGQWLVDNGYFGKVE